MEFIVKDNKQYLSETSMSVYSRMQVILRNYENIYYEMYQKAKLEVVQAKYAVGGELVHRGVYYPSLVSDLLIGNNKRGRFLLRNTAKSRPTYTYGLDKQGRLRVLDDDGGGAEVLIYDEGQIVYGIYFDNRKGKGRLINGICECIYDETGRILRYTTASLTHEDKFPISNARQESYSYDEKGVHTMEYCEHFGKTIGCSMQLCKYTFFHDHDGFITGYDTIEFGSFRKQSISKFEGMKFNGKRKV